MRSFNYFMGKMALVFTILLFSSVLLATIYFFTTHISIGDLVVSDNDHFGVIVDDDVNVNIGKGFGVNVGDEVNVNLGGFGVHVGEEVIVDLGLLGVNVGEDVKVNLGNFGINIGEDFSIGNTNRNLDTITDTIEETFSSNHNLNISSSLAEVTIIKEEREDIKVEYSYTKPDTPSYQLDFDTTVKNGTIYVDEKISIRNLVSNKKYRSYITVYVPESYKPEYYTLHLAMGEIEQEAILDTAENYDIKANMGDVEIEVEAPKSKVNIEASMGDIHITNTASIEELTCHSNSGKVRIESDGQIETLSATNNMGEVEIDAKGIVNSCVAHTDMGEVTGTFHQRISNFSVTTSMGDAELNLYANKDITIYATTGMGKVTSDFPILKDQEIKDQYYIHSNMGDVKVTK